MPKLVFQDLVVQQRCHIDVSCKRSNWDLHESDSDVDRTFGRQLLQDNRQPGKQSRGLLLVHALCDGVSIIEHKHVLLVASLIEQ